MHGPQICTNAGKATTDTGATVRHAPLTFQQEWAVKHWMEYDVPYSVAVTLHLKGVLYPDLLCRSLSVVVDRHEALRTRIVVFNDVLQQESCEQQSFRCPW